MRILTVLLLIIVSAVVGFAACFACTRLFKEEPLPVYEHEWATAALQNPFCVEDGVVLRTCKECHGEERIVLPASGHLVQDNSCKKCGQAAGRGLRFKFGMDEEGIPFAVVTGMGSCTDIHLVIPDVMGGIPVREIAENAFRGNMQIVSVSFHTGITKIGKDAFKDCTNLSGIFLPEGLTEDIALGAFGNTAYANEEGNWKDGKLQSNGYILEQVDGLD